MRENQNTQVRKGRLADIFSELFILSTQLKNARDYGDPASLRRRIIDIFDQVDRKGYSAGISKENMLQSKYAVAAFLDEIILGSPWPQKDQWRARPLQFEFFNEHVAGVEFFNRLETLRRIAATQKDVLEVYYLCLILGFEGQYMLHGEAKLKSLMTELSREIEASRGGNGKLAPNGARPEEFIEMVKSGLPSWVILVAAATIVFFFFVTLSFLSRNDATEVAQNLIQLLETPRLEVGQ